MMMQSPFQPFMIYMADGREFRVDHLDFILAPPGENEHIVFVDQETGRLHLVSPTLITSVAAVPSVQSPAVS